MTFTPDLVTTDGEYEVMIPDLEGSVNVGLTFGCGVDGRAYRGHDGEYAALVCDGNNRFSLESESGYYLGDVLVSDPLSLLLDPTNGGALDVPVSWTLSIPGFGGALVTSLEVEGVDPRSKEDCKDGGWAHYGFKNQGQCVRFVETGKDSR